MRPVNWRSRRSGVALGFVLLVIAAAALVLVAAGCGSSNSSSSPSPSSTTAATWTPADLAALQADSSLKGMLPAGMTTIRVASDIPYPPWEMYTAPGSNIPTGFDYDLSQAIAKKIGVPASFNETPFDGIILSIKAGKNDMIMSDMYDNLEREGQGVSFVDYALDGTSVLVLKGNPKGVSNLDSLAGQTVACESGTTQQKFLQTLNAKFKSSGKAQMTILSLPNQPAALLAVTSGRAVGDLTDHSTASNIAMTTKNGQTFEVVSDPSAPTGYDPQLVGIGIVAKNAPLLNTVQKALQALIDEGAYQKIIAKYGLLAVQSAQINQGGKSPSPSPTP